MKNHLYTTAIAISFALLASSCTSEPPSIQEQPDTLASAHPEMVVYKSPTCGCCQDWVDYIDTAGFDVTTIETDDVDSVKAENGLTDASLKSCHTALIDGYVIEGHVPVSDIERLLAEQPDIVGLSAPGMPMMSPGMGSETPKDYDVLAFDKNGRTLVYSSY